MAKMCNKERTTDFELNKRIQIVAKAILNGYTNRKFLLQYITETNDWNVSERTLDNYIKSAKEMLDGVLENDLEYEKTIALNRLDSLYFMNYKIHDFRECRNIIESRAKILGLNASDKIDITSKGNELKQQVIIVQDKETKDIIENMQ